MNTKYDFMKGNGGKLREEIQIQFCKAASDSLHSAGGGTFLCAANWKTRHFLYGKISTHFGFVILHSVFVSHGYSFRMFLSMC